MLSSCTSQKSKEVENEIPDFYGFTTDVYTTVNDVKISGKAHYIAYNTLTLTFTSPETLKDMKIIVKDGECEVTLHELSFSLSNESLPFNALSNAILSCGENVKSATYKSGIYSYISNENRYEIYADNDTKNFQKLVINGTDTLYFENFRYITGQSE